MALPKSPIALPHRKKGLCPLSKPLTLSLPASEIRESCPQRIYSKSIAPIGQAFLHNLQNLQSSFFHSIPLSESFRAFAGQIPTQAPHLTHLSLSILSSIIEFEKFLYCWQVLLSQTFQDILMPLKVLSDIFKNFN